MIYSGDSDKRVLCPYCQSECRTEFVSTEPGAYVQVDPYRCDSCKAYEIGYFDKKRELTLQEELTHWYKPGSSGDIEEGAKVALEAFELEFSRKVKLSSEMWKQIESNEETMAENAAIAATFEQYGLDEIEGWDILHHFQVEVQQ